MKLDFVPDTIDILIAAEIIRPSCILSEITHTPIKLRISLVFNWHFKAL